MGYIRVHRDKLSTHQTLGNFHPYYKLYNHHKLDTHSLSCAFLGYSNNQSAFKSLDPNSKFFFLSPCVSLVEAFSYHMQPTQFSQDNKILAVYTHVNRGAMNNDTRVMRLI